MLLDAARPWLTRRPGRWITGQNMNWIRRAVSEAKKFITESCQKVVHNSMQVVGGIGCTNVFPLERIYRDIRLASIWTGTSEIMSIITAHEWYWEFLGKEIDTRPLDHEAFAEEEKIYE